jgi:chemotaxis protein MotB
MSRRRKKHPQHANHERWMVSYADFVTLLFAFFVVMFATANADRGKVSAVAAAVRSALDQGNVSNVVRALSEITSKPAQTAAALPAPDKDQASTREARAMSELLPSMELLEKELKPEIQSGAVELHMEARGLAISFKQAALFQSGSDELLASAIKTIGRVGAALLKVPNAVRVEGHTDNQPISNLRFRSNWDLSAARAISVLDLLTSKFSVPRSRMSIGGYADVAPVAENNSDEGRARNRRVDVVILSDFGAAAEPSRNTAAKNR